MSENVKPSKSGGYLDVETWEALKAAGHTEEELLADQPFGPMISCYTREQAMEDGVLADVTELARQSGFRLHTVMTCGVVAEVTAGIVNPLNKRLALVAVLDRLHEAVRRQKEPSDRIDFEVGPHKLWALVGPGDTAAPVLTIMLVGED
jgi:hypothetical protein